ncbi:MAG: TonB-dependent receptor [Candidatus Kapaibacteriales bacterium]
MKYFQVLSLFLILTTAYSVEYTLSGYVREFDSGETIIGAKVSIPSAKTGAVSNAYGFYSITLEEGNYEVLVAYPGFDNYSNTIELDKDIKLDIGLKTIDVESEEITIIAQRENQNVTSNQMSTIELSTAVIQKLPALLGEVDVVKSIQLLPGVTTVGEGASGFNVRGGGIDQNLVLLDEAPVYNSSHLFGFFSVFNPDAVKDVKLIKGGIPANYGGRLSSILDVRMKDGNYKEWEGTGGVGAIFSRGAIEGPIIEDQMSIILAGRRSYIDVLAQPFLEDGLEDSDFYFYDLTGKLNWKIGDSDQLFASYYNGRDVFGAGFIFNWGNETFSLRWNHLFSDKFFMNVTGLLSNYDYQLGFGDDDQDRFDWNSNIQTYTLKAAATYYYNADNEFDFGYDGNYYIFEPGNAVGISNGVSVPISLENQFGLEQGIYADHSIKFNELFTLEYGLRLSNYTYLSDSRAFYYRDTTPGIQRPIDRIDDLNGELTDVANYTNLEPRLSATYILDESSSVKTSYNRMVQYLHLLSNTAASSPLDLWTTTTNNLQPQLADQIALGYFKNFDDNKWETSVEGYYKILQNQVDYIDGADLLLNEELESDLIYGDGRAYGVEFYLKKGFGELNGWISYTLARTERQIEGINKGDWYPARFDQTHNLRVVAIWDFAEQWSTSASFVLTSGTPATFPTNRYEIQGYVVPHNFDNRRNNYRIPWYHRLDLSLTWDFDKGEKDVVWDDELVFSIYNVYNRRNPFSIYFRQNETNPNMTEAVRLAIFGSIVPSITYNFSF